MHAEPHRDPSDRLVLTTLAARDGNVAATWQQLSRSGWRLPSLTTFRRRVHRLTAMHPAPLPRSRHNTSGATPSDAPTQPNPQPSRGDVLVVAIDVDERDVIRSWVVPRSSRRGSQIEAAVRNALGLRSHLMLDLSEFAAHHKDAR